MEKNALHHFIEELSKIWNPINSDLTKKSKQLLEELTQNCIGESWMNDLIENQYPAKEIYKSKEHGFILMGHVENEGVMSPPHDHGNGWVLYATVSGNVQMGIYHPIISQNGILNLVQKDSYVLSPGQCSIYLPGDIHDTKSLEDTTVMLRLTSCDFHKEFDEGRLIRYTNEVSKW